MIAGDDKIPDLKRFVEKDREETKDVRQHVLRGERERNPADAESRNQRRDLDPDVIEKQNQRDPPDDAFGDANQPTHGKRVAVQLAFAEF